jgi:hypothetical protein
VEHLPEIVCRIADYKGRYDVGFTTKLATRYWLKTIIMSIVCVVLGLWGVWDYAVAIPRAAMEAGRADTLRIVKNGLDSVPGSEHRAEAVVVLDSAMMADDRLDESWSDSLDAMRFAMIDGGAESHRNSLVNVEGWLSKYGNTTAPSKYDRPMQWMFILCLPFGLYYIFMYVKMSKRANSYLLTEEGVLTTPEGTWSRDEIEDIDMSRWIAKTGNARSTWTAKVVLKDGKRILLDDYVYSGMHSIIGKLAHGFHPDEWTPLAKRLKTQTTDTKEEEGA